MKIDRLLVCGDREWTDRDLIHDTLDNLSPRVVIHGGCQGADKLACEWADKWEGRECPLSVAYPANWEKYGKAAGPIRNQQMIDEGKPDAVVAFHDNLSKSVGTRDMIVRAQKAGLPVLFVCHEHSAPCDVGDKQKGFPI